MQSSRSADIKQALALHSDLLPYFH